MDCATQIRLIEKILALETAQACDAVTDTASLPVQVYLDEARAQRERDMLFRRLPLIAARSEQLPSPGSFLTLELGEVPLLLTRDRSGVNAMINVCRHRGTRVCMEASGRRDRFICPYHAWNYDAQGHLLRISHEAGFDGLDRSQLGLVRLPVCERHGFIWVVPSPGAALDLPEFLGELDGDFQRLQLDAQVSYQPLRRDLNMNWKLAIDIFLEAYHVRFVHVRSIYPIFFDNIGLFERFAPHQRTLFPKRSIVSLRGTDPQDWQLRAHSNVLYQLFPNTLILVQPDHVSCFHILPTALDRCTLSGYTLLTQAPQTDKARDYWQKNIDILSNATNEDFVMGESIQRGLRSGANQRLQFGRYEQSLMWFHDSIEQVLQSPAA